MEIDLNPVEAMVKERAGQPETLIEALQEVQRHYRYLPETALRRVAGALAVPLSKVYAVATFYSAFSLTPRGRNVVRLCKGTACHVRGATLLEEEIAQAVGVAPGKTAEDLSYTFETVNCLGACAMAPVLVINDKYHGNVRLRDVRGLVSESREE